LIAARYRNAKSLRLWYGWGILFAIFVILTIIIGVRNSIGVFFKEISGAFGWNRAQTAAAFTMRMLGQAVAAPFTGWALERFNIRWVIAAGIIVNGCALLIGAHIGALWHFYAMYFLLSVGFALGFVRPTASSLLADHFAGPGFGLLNGCAMIVFSIVGALGPLVTGMLFDASGTYYGGFLIAGGMFIAGTLFLARLSRLPRPERG